MFSVLELTLEAYRAILEGLPAAVYVVDRERRIALWDEGCERITGYRRHEVIGRCCADNLLMHCNDRDEIMCGNGCPLLGTMQDGRPREADLFLLHKDGQRVPVRVHAVPLRNEAGAIIGACECFEERTLSMASGRDTVQKETGGFAHEVTQLPDKRGILDKLRGSLEDFRESRVPFGVLCLAVDELKGMLTNRGGNAVSNVLQATGQTLAKGAGPGNLVGYWSDERFMAILSGCSETGLRRWATALGRLAAAEAIPWWGDHLKITLSAGGTVGRAEDTAEEIARRAEEALTKAMEAGGSQVFVV